MQLPVQIPYGNASHFAMTGVARDQCRLEIETAARSNESPRSRMLRSFLAGSYVIPIGLLYILFG